MRDASDQLSVPVKIAFTVRRWLTQLHGRASWLQLAWQDRCPDDGHTFKRSPRKPKVFDLYWAKMMICL
jgi:hypothetical protein